MPLNCRKINFHGKRSSEEEVPCAETLQKKKKQQQAKPVVWAVWKSFQSSFTLIYEVLCYGCKLRHMFDILWSTIKLLNVIEKANSRHFICVCVKKREANTCSATVWQLFSTYSSYHFHHYHHQHNNQSVRELCGSECGILSMFVEINFGIFYIISLFYVYLLWS